MIRILLVEDDESIIRSLTEFLTGEGFAISAVPGQKEALDSWKRIRMTWCCWTFL